MIVGIFYLASESLVLHLLGSCIFAIWSKWPFFIFVFFDMQTEFRDPLPEYYIAIFFSLEAFIRLNT